MKIRVVLLTLFLFTSCPSFVVAQDLDGYSPPPMFGAQKPVPKKEATRPIDKLPSVSKEVPEVKLEPDRKVTKPTTPKVIKQPVLDAPVVGTPTKRVVEVTAPQKIKTPPVPKAKPRADEEDLQVKEPLTTVKIISTPAPAKSIEPIDLIKEPEKEQLKPVIAPEVVEKPKEVVPQTVEIIEPPKIDKEGVVKGPKSMPAVGKKDVQAESTYQEVEKPKSTFTNMFDRLKRDKQEKAEKLVEEKERQDERSAKLVDLTIKTNEVNDTAVKNKNANVLAENYILVFAAGEAELNEKHQSQLLTNIIPILDSDIALTLNINAYATALDGVSFSDRRIALNRALAIRDYLLEQKIEAARINMRSHGFDPSKSPADQIEMGFSKLGN